MGASAKDGVKLIIAAVWGVIAGFLTIGALVTGSFFAALLLALSGIIALPQARRFLSQYNITGGKRVALSGAAALGGMIIIGANGPVTPIAKPTEEASTSRSSEKQEDPVGIAANRASAPSENTASKAAFLGQYRSVLALAKPCDRSIGVVGEAASSGSLVNLYSAARQGQEACQTAWLDIQKLEPENVPTDVEAKQTKAIETCGSAYFLRQRAMETAMKIADGDAKASNIVSLQDDLKLGQTGVMMCVAQWMEAGTALGIKLDEMK